MLEHEVSSLVTAWHAIIVGSLLASLLSVFLALLLSLVPCQDYFWPTPSLALHFPALTGKNRELRTQCCRYVGGKSGSIILVKSIR